MTNDQSLSREFHFALQSIRSTIPNASAGLQSLEVRKILALTIARMRGISEDFYSRIQ
jgi:hypothetical protein